MDLVEQKYPPSQQKSPFPLRPSKDKKGCIFPRPKGFPKRLLTLKEVEETFERVENDVPFSPMVR